MVPMRLLLRICRLTDKTVSFARPSSKSSAEAHGVYRLRSTSGSESRNRWYAMSKASLAVDVLEFIDSVSCSATSTTFTKPDQLTS